MAWEGQQIREMTTPDGLEGPRGEKQQRSAFSKAAAHRESWDGFVEQRGLNLIGSFISMFKIIIKNSSLNGFFSPQAIQAAARFPFGLKILLLICYKNLHVVERLLESSRWEGHTFAATGTEGISFLLLTFGSRNGNKDGGRGVTEELAQIKREKITICRK